MLSLDTEQQGEERTDLFPGAGLKRLQSALLPTTVPLSLAKLLALAIAHSCVGVAMRFQSERVQVTWASVPPQMTVKFSSGTGPDIARAVLAAF